METILKNLGLSRRESDIMGLLLEHQDHPLRSREIAGEVEVPRQTAYSILRSMADRGLIIQTNINGVTFFYTNIKELVKFIDLERDRLLKTKEAIKGGESSLLKQPAPSNLPQVYFYEGALGIRKLFESILDIYKKGKSKKFRGYGINQFSDSKPLNDYLRYFVKKRGSYDVQTHLFIGEGADDFHITDNKSAFGRTVRRIDIEPQQAGVYFVANRAYLFSYKDNIGIMIENRAIVTLLKDAFDDHWNRVNK